MIYYWNTARWLKQYFRVGEFSGVRMQNSKSRSLLGFENRLGSILLVYYLMLSKAQKRYGGTLKYSLGRF